MQYSHPLLRSLLGVVTTEPHYYGDSAACGEMAAKAATPKAATMLTLGCVLAAWEDSTGKHTWRGPTRWDTRVMGALTEWGYLPSDVEALLTASRTVDTAADCDVDAA
jgi:ParB family chromosome partitioning protein